MEKKIYTAPTLSVEEYDMTQVICTSNQVNHISSGDGVNLGYGGSDANYTGGARANNRGGIWDED